MHELLGCAWPLYLGVDQHLPALRQRQRAMLADRMACIFWAACSFAALLSVAYLARYFILAGRLVGWASLHWLCK